MSNRNQENLPAIVIKPNRQSYCNCLRQRTSTFFTQRRTKLLLTNRDKKNRHHMSRSKKSKIYRKPRDTRWLRTSDLRHKK